MLLVDDEDRVRSVVRICLQLEEDFTVVGEAASGEQAIKAAAELRPDVVLLDLDMPDMSGLDALPAIRSASPGSRVAVLSAYPDPYTLTETLALGAHICLDKAMSLAQLPSALRALLGGGSV